MTMAFRDNSKGSFRDKRSGMMRRTRDRLRLAYSNEDKLVGQVVNAIEDSDRTVNLFSERLREWYAVYDPELKNADNVKYAKAVLEAKEREEGTVGGKVKLEDVEVMRTLAREIVSLSELRSSLEAYQKQLAERICPNVCQLTEAAVAAKLIANAGSMQRLATLPASTIQVLGAEKALFKHLKSGSPPPKHGIIFQHAYISTAPKKQRGRIARALATKIAIATKADFFTKNNIAPKLRDDFEKRVRQIREKG
ncbi:putative NOP5 family protein [Candidatus Gugararchaeum adminiculabundum]|nr:putative NOP5 family protein [Candidatus Gugararchaeum adminiculabundum]